MILMTWWDLMLVHFQSRCILQLMCSLTWICSSVNPPIRSSTGTKLSALTWAVGILGARERPTRAVDPLRQRNKAIFLLRVWVFQRSENVEKIVKTASAAKKLVWRGFEFFSQIIRWVATVWVWPPKLIV